MSDSESDSVPEVSLAWCQMICGKAAVLVTTAAFLGVCAVGAAQLKMEFHYDWFVPKDTELKGTMAIRDAHFGGMYLPVDMVTKEADYFTNIASYKQMVDEFRANPDILAGSTDAWYRSALKHPESPAFGQ